MSAFPVSPRAAFIGWCEVHAPVFAAQAGAIGLTEEQAAGFGGATAALQGAVLEQLEALQVYEAATQRVQDRRAALRSAAGAAVASIRAFAERQPKPDDVYARAMIPAPAAPSPAPPPAQPQRLSARIEAVTGNIQLRWKASNPPGTSGTSYIVRRRIVYAAPAAGHAEAAGDGSARRQLDAGLPDYGIGANGQRAAARQITGPWEFLGVTGKKRFVDATLRLAPALFAGPDAPRVVYCVQGQRADVSGPPSDGLSVQLGQSTAASIVSNAAPGTAPSVARRYSHAGRTRGFACGQD